MLCITVPLADGRFAMIVSNKVLSTSRHIDYAHYRFKEDDHPVLKAGVEKFVTLNAAYDIVDVIDAAHLRQKGVSYKSAKRLPNELPDAEIRQVSGAIAKVMLYEALYDLRPADASEAESSTSIVNVNRPSTQAGDTEAADSPPSPVSFGLPDAVEQVPTTAGEGDDVIKIDEGQGVQVSVGDEAAANMTSTRPSRKRRRR